MPAFDAAAWIRAWRAAGGQIGAYDGRAQLYFPEEHWEALDRLNAELRARPADRAAVKAYLLERAPLSMEIN